MLSPPGHTMSHVQRWASGSWIRWALLIIVATFMLIQFVPYGHGHSNPPVTQQAGFDSQGTEQLVDDACGACHSNLTDWPLDSNVAPFSWLVQSDVEGGRGILNFSEWDRSGQPAFDEVAEAIDSGEMPPLQYKLMHSGARLSDTEKQQLIDGLARTYQQDPPGP